MGLRIMATEHLIYLSIPGLRPGDVRPDTTPTLYEWANSGALAELQPTFPCVTSCVQASAWTGRTPGEHGVIANGFFDRDKREVEFWVALNDVIAGDQIWSAIRRARPDFTSAVWHGQNIKGADADFIVTPAPIHEPDGTTRLWCYSKPDGLYQQLIDKLGHFPLQHYWGPLAGIQSTQWILDAATLLIRDHAPNFHWIYIPHLDYAAQKFGPDSGQANASLVELDAVLRDFARQVSATNIAADAVFLAAGEYALTPVTAPIFPNRILREAGLLSVRAADGAEYVDLQNSTAFAMVDHQLAHVYLRDRHQAVIARCQELFANVEGVAAVYAGDERHAIGMIPGTNGQPAVAEQAATANSEPRPLGSGLTPQFRAATVRERSTSDQVERGEHVESPANAAPGVVPLPDHSGDLILISDDSHWFAYYCWLDDAKAPPFARTVDIHRKPGYDPVELFFDTATRSIPLDANLVKGSHGVPATAPRHRTALICSKPTPAVTPGRIYSDTDLKQISLALLGL